ncbi:MAG: hypothetical protein ACRDZ9_07785 [Acidimicrobiales bacterium]
MRTGTHRGLTLASRGIGGVYRAEAEAVRSRGGVPLGVVRPLPT